MLKPAENKLDGFEDYAQWVQKRTGHNLLSNKNDTVINENDLDKSEISVIERQDLKSCVHPQHADEPKITFIKDGEVISRIEIHCTCGEIIELELDYQS